MNIWHYELTDKRSATVRLALRLFWFLLGLAFGWLLLQPRGAVIRLIIAAVFYLSLLGFALDHWKLRHPETSDATMRWVATLAIAPILMVGIPLLVFLFR